MRASARRTVHRGYATTVTSGLLISLAVALALLGNIRLKDDLNRLEAEIGRLDRELAIRKRGNERLRMDYETLVSAEGLNQRVREMRLDLVMPGDDARIVLPEPPAESSTSRHATPSSVSDRLAMSNRR